MHKQKTDLIGKDRAIMKTISIQSSWTGDTNQSDWDARYQVTQGTNAIYVKISARSEIELVVAKLPDPDGYTGKSYFISSPNFGVAIPGIPSLFETFWITEQLVAKDMPEADAMSAAQVLRDIEAF